MYDRLGLYIDQTFELIVITWLDAGEDFVLAEDNDSSHGLSKSNIVRLWKERHGFRYYFNCAWLPDLAPIENFWQPARIHLRKYPHWDNNVERG